MKKRSPNRYCDGFTLLELLVVLVVMGMLAAIVTPQVMSMLSGAKSNAVGLQIETLSTALNYYQLDIGSYPSQEQGLDALWQRPKETDNWRGPYIRKTAASAGPLGAEIPLSRARATRSIRYLFTRSGRKGRGEWR